MRRSTVLSLPLYLVFHNPCFLSTIGLLLHHSQLMSVSLVVYGSTNCATALTLGIKMYFYP
jgi:hypothetical protein